MNLIPIGFAGRRLDPDGNFLNNNNVGKDTVADALETITKEMYKHKYMVYRRNLAYPVKACCIQKFGIGWRHFDRENKEIKNIKVGDGMYSPRELAQLEGTDYGRKVYGESIWIDTLINSEKEQLHYDKIYNRIVIIGDIRFENEAQWVRDKGILIHVSRVDKQEKYSQKTFDNLHPSEMMVSYKPQSDIILDNNGTLEAIPTLCYQLLMSNIRPIL
ncbi:MAG: hypothetical protein QM489_00790 [Candidatus Izemoplasma sp.]